MMFSLRTFRKEEDGTILVFAALCLAMIIGFAALTFDLGRMASTQTDLQAYADHVALAAAGELDGNPDSITRATNAAGAMIVDKQFFADGDKTLDSAADFSLRFLTGLPTPAADPDDDDAVDSFVTTDPALAVMVEVTATPRTVFIPFARALASLVGAATPNEQVGAQAIAGYTSYACDVTPLMFCIPPNWSASDPAIVGTTIKLRTGGNNSAWGPGNFGFLDPTDYGINPQGPCNGLTGANLYICLIAADGNKGRCVAQRGVDTEPGQRNGIGSAIYNSRFDYFSGTMNNLKTVEAYAPAPNVISGWNRSGNSNGNGTGPNCINGQPEVSLDTLPLPPDDCFVDDSCSFPGGGGRFGDGDWSDGRSDYLTQNYGVGLDPDNELPAHSQGLKVDALNAMPASTTRYQMYLEEIDQFGSGDILEQRQENGRPQCNAPATSTDPDRRTFILAAVDCAANNVQGRAEDVTVKEYVKGFLIQPLANTTGTDFDIFLEVVSQVGGDGLGGNEDDGIFRDVVRLYR
ncbi:MULTISPECIES: Tad domain-containing protein [unclassified Ruegeria]|uniref:Tad domain-containing protein n=1 Tax=unclassified Ruegeria TaxID=2625375 RepID=UPI001488C54E|nr:MULTISPECIES: Tad domain-containing protein [unclassified Ruegeria]